MAWTFECNYTEEGLTLYSLKKDAKGAQKINQGILQNFSFYILQKKESNAGKKKKRMWGWAHDDRMFVVNYFRAINCEKSPWSQH